MTNTWLIRRGIVAELIQNESKEWGIGEHESLDSFMKRNASPSVVFNASAPVRYVDITEKRAIVVAEDAPRYRTINTASAATRFPIPWCYTIHRYQKSGANWNLENMYIGIRGTPITDVQQDEIFALPIENIFEDMRVCFGDTSFDTCPDLGKMICRPINTFWGSVFTREALPLKSSFFATKANWRKMRLDTVCEAEFKRPRKIRDFIQG